GPQDVAAQRPAAALNAVRLAARALPRALGRAKTRRRDHLSDMDGRQPPAPHGLRRAARGQAGERGPAMKTLLALFACAVTGIAENAFANEGDPASGAALI